MKDSVGDFIANIPEDVKREIKKKYIEYMVRDHRGNAKIYTTIANRLYLMYKFGVITEDQLKDMLEKNMFEEEEE